MMIQKQDILQLLFNQMNLNVNRMVILLNNKNAAQVMNEKEIKQSIRMYMTRFYVTENSAMQQFKEK